MTAKQDSERVRMSSGELDVMCEVWRLGRVSVTQLQQAYNERHQRSLTRNTIQVQLQRIEAKGWLIREKEGRTFYYLPAVAYEEAASEMATEFQDQVFDGSSVALIRCLFETGDLKPDEIEQLRSLISEAERKQ